MAKKYYKAPIHQVGTVITTKSAFGSHSDMVVDINKYSSDPVIVLQNNQVVCKDDKGFYITEKNRIDSGLADANRHSNRKARIHLEEIKETAT
jgi:hypothetical protein